MAGVIKRSALWLILGAGGLTLWLAWNGWPQSDWCSVSVQAGSAATGTPAIDLHHVLCGGINRHGRAVGLHVRPDSSSGQTGVVRLIDPPDQRGVYTAVVQIEGVRKQGFSSFFPDHCRIRQIVNSIRYAYHHCRSCSARFRGPSAPDSSDQQSFCLGVNGQDFTVEGWYRGQRIATAYPIRQ